MRLPNKILATLLLIASAALPLEAAPPRPYDLELVVRPPFRFLSRLGAITAHVYRDGITGSNFLFSGFSRNGEKFVTVRSPITRLYGEVALDSIGAFLRSHATGNDPAPPDAEYPLDPQIVTRPIAGLVAKRFRFLLAPGSWLDIWMTEEIPANPQMKALVGSAVGGFAPRFGTSLTRLTGTPLHIEVNSEHFHHAVLLHATRFRWNVNPEKGSFSVGRFYARAPFTSVLSGAPSRH